jgi:DnaJ-class molecular chaperone
MFLSDLQQRCLEQLAKDKGETVTCHNCGSQRLGVHKYESDWLLGGSFQVALECSDCGAGSDFIISSEEARDCGLDPRLNLADDGP